MEILNDSSGRVCDNRSHLYFAITSSTNQGHIESDFGSASTVHVFGDKEHHYDIANFNGVDGNWLTFRFFFSVMDEHFGLLKGLGVYGRRYIYQMGMHSEHKHSS